MTELCRPFPWFGKLITLYVMRKQLASKEQNGDLLLGLSGLRLQLNMCVFQLAASLTALVSVAIHVLG